MAFTKTDVREGRALVAQGTAARLALGQLVLKRVPMQARGGQLPTAEGSQNSANLIMEFAEAIGETARKVEQARFVAHFYQGHKAATRYSWSVLVEARDAANGDPAAALRLIEEAKVDGAPSVVRLRQNLGKRSPDAGKVHKIVETATPAEKVQVAKAVLADPDVAAEVMYDKPTRDRVNEAEVKAVERRRSEQGRVKPKPTPEEVTDKAVMAIRTELFRLTTAYREAVRHVMDLDTADRGLVRDEMTKVNRWHELLAALVQGDSMDDELAALLSEGT